MVSVAPFHRIVMNFSKSKSLFSLLGNNNEHVSGLKEHRLVFRKKKKKVYTVRNKKGTLPELIDKP